jgi:outer membrane receptor protein involved in Fe transport
MGGLRYFDTSRNQVSQILTPFLNSTFIQGAPAGPDPRTDSSESDVLFKGQAVYRPTEDHQIYAQVAQGYRAGGVNSQTVSQIPAEYDSDQTLNLEAGVKTSWLDGRLLANLSVYTIDWDNIQFQMPYTQQFNGLVNCTEVSDAVTAEGFEIDLQAQATDNLDIGFNFTSMDAKWNVDANDCLSQAEIEGTTFDDDGDGLGDGTGILAGDSMIGVPDHSGSAYAQYNFGNVPFGADSAFLRADIMFQGTVPTNDDDPAINLANPSYELVNINGGIDFGRYSLSVFVRNVFDKKAHLSLFQGFQQDNRVTPSNPRTIGASFTYNFSD